MMTSKQETWTASLLILAMWVVLHSIGLSVSLYKYPESRDIFLQKAILGLLFNGAFTLGTFLWFRKYVYPVSRTGSMIRLGLILLLGSSAILMGSEIALSSLTDGVGRLTSWTLTLRMGNQIVRMLPFLMLFYALKFAHDRRQERKMRLQSEQVARTARLELLTHQLNPHFLFNALHTVRTLIEHQPREARGIITDLSDYLRYSLKRAHQSMAPLHEEYQSLLTYLRIQKKRFQENLTIRTSLSPEARDVPVPVFILHPLIENAVKYGSQTCKGHLALSVAIDTTPRGVKIEIANSGHIPPQPQEEGTGIGLENTRQRVALHYGPRGQVLLNERDGWVTATLILES